MFIEVAWILVTAATGSCSSTCQSDTKMDICTLDPDMGSGEGRAWAWFYDWRTDKCIDVKFGIVDDDTHEQNIFAFEDQCNSKCRRGVSNNCFEDPPNAEVNKGTEKWTYNYSSTKCVKFFWKGTGSKANVFNSEAECSQQCRIPDLGLCANGFYYECKHGDDLYIRYNYQKQICEILKPHQCPKGGNAFYTFRQCYQRCGRFVDDKCKLPIQNMSYCSKVHTRYGYNTKTNRCEKFQGCADSGNSFPTAKECWETCAKASKHRCVQDPDYILWGAFGRYYYDINSHKCVSKSLIRGKVTGKSNLFYTQQECEETCMATYVDEPDWL